MTMVTLLIGCTSSVSAGPTTLLVLALLAVTACVGRMAPLSATNSPIDATGGDSNSPIDATGGDNNSPIDATGGDKWHPCCVGGEALSCKCPANSSCNLGYCVNDDGTCGPSLDWGIRPCNAAGNDATDAAPMDSSDAGAVEADVADGDGILPVVDDSVGDEGDEGDEGDVTDIATDVADGTESLAWHPCCIGGKLSTCACEANSSCNWSVCLHPDGSCSPGQGGFGMSQCVPDVSEGDLPSDGAEVDDNDAAGAVDVTGDSGVCDGQTAPDGACNP